jgi:hypothetical protein
MNAFAMIVHPNSLELNSPAPPWEQFPAECQVELIQALAALLLNLPQLQILQDEMLAQGADDEPRQSDQP